MTFELRMYLLSGDNNLTIHGMVGNKLSHTILGDSLTSVYHGRDRGRLETSV